MDALSQNTLVLQDLMLFAAILAAVGFATYHIAYRLAPLRRWSSHGTVPTGEFGILDVFLAIILLSFLFAIQSGGPAPGAVEQVAQDPAQATFGGAFMILNVLMIGAVPLAYLGLVKRISLSELFGLRRLKITTAFLWAVCGIIAVLIPVGLASAGSNSLLETIGLDASPQDAVQLIGNTKSPLALALMIFAAVVAAPLAEEVVFRGFLYPVIKRYSDRFFAAFLSGLLFALAHSHLGSLLPLLVLGIALAAAFEISGSLLVPIGMHALFNSMSIAALLSGMGETP